ncbi:hypothetical protein [Bradyrhizobium sp. AS23.2]|uniref:hypothetical protein n=1 Tax=Bradyrhizobium sp. AS23.2 TaxID=1680155 RepID=UPI00093EC332|nr:hypothetical protein [Bradyrhizobium sp. AS23.2]OKO67980.1 hypothetical protein AC630_39615 [Bradyrhizobium sp. AS23.2]
MTASRRSTTVIPAALFLTLISGTLARAQDGVPTLLPEVIVKPPSRPLGPADANQGAGSSAATDAKKDDGKAFEKLNREFKRKVDEVNPTANTPPLDARSPDTKIGIVNIPGVQQQATLR